MLDTMKKSATIGTFRVFLADCNTPKTFNSLLNVAVIETRHCVLPERYVNVSMTPTLSAYDRAITETGGGR